MRLFVRMSVCFVVLFLIFPNVFSGSPSLFEGKVQAAPNLPPLVVEMAGEWVDFPARPLCGGDFQFCPIKINGRPAILVVHGNGVDLSYVPKD